MKPNQMPKRQQSKIRQQMIAGLIEKRPATRTRHVWGKDSEGELTPTTVKETVEELRFPLAQNVSEESVERLAKRWL